MARHPNTGYKSNHRCKNEERQAIADKGIQPAASQKAGQCQGDREDVTDRSISRRSCGENNTGQHGPTFTLLRRASQGKARRSRLIDHNRTQSSRKQRFCHSVLEFRTRPTSVPGCQGTSQALAGGVGAETTGKPLDSPVGSLYEQSASGASGSSFSYLLTSPGVNIECTDVRLGLEEVPQGLVYVPILLAVITLSVLFRLPEAESEPRSGSASELRMISSSKPFCFFRMGTPFSLIVLESSFAFPGLLVSSTTRVNICLLLSSVSLLKGTAGGAATEQFACISPTYSSSESRLIIWNSCLTLFQ